MEAKCSGEDTLVSLIALDQTLLVFDVEQKNNAKQTLTLRKLSTDPFIAWRFQTNAPTRYLVYPNKGVLTNEVNKVTVTIELVKNAYNPRHQMFLQSMSVDIRSINKLDELWKNDDKVISKEVQMTTTYLHLEHTSHVGNQAISESVLSKVMANSATVGEERVKELKNLLDMLRSDNDQLAKNLIQTENLKKVLTEQILAKQTQFTEAEKRLKMINAEVEKTSAELRKTEGELKVLRSKPRTMVVQQGQCSLM